MAYTANRQILFNNFAKHMGRSDEDLIQFYLNGEESALRDLIARYFRAVYNL